MTVDPEAPAPTNIGVALGQNPVAGNGNTFIVSFDNRGLLAGVRDGQGNASPTTGALDMGVSFDVAGRDAGRGRRRHQADLPDQPRDGRLRRRTR